MRALRLAAGGGTLSASSVLLNESARYPAIAQALLSPGGKAVTLVVLRGPYLDKDNPLPKYFQVVHVPLTSGRPRLLYRALVGDRVGLFLGSDATGRYLLVAGLHNGWLDHGMLRPLAPQGGYVFAEAW